MKTLLLLLLSSLAALGAESAILTWYPNPEPDIAGYRLSYGTAPGVHTKVVDVLGKTEVTVNDLELGTTYYFVVAAFNQGGYTGPNSEEISYMPVPPPTPDSPTGLLAERYSQETGQTWTWSAPATLPEADIERYELDYWRVNDDGTLGTVVTLVAGKATTVTTVNLPAGNYRCYVRVVNLAGISSLPSSTVQFVIPTIPSAPRVLRILPVYSTEDGKEWKLDGYYAPRPNPDGSYPDKTFFKMEAELATITTD